MTEMHDHEVEIYPAGEDQVDVARKLLAAASELGLPPEVVRTVSDGGFRAPREVADAAHVTPTVDSDSEPADDVSEEPKPKRPRGRR